MVLSSLTLLLWGSQGFHRPCKNDKFVFFKQLPKPARPWLTLPADGSALINSGDIHIQFQSCKDIISIMQTQGTRLSLLF